MKSKNKLLLFVVVIIVMVISTICTSSIAQSSFSNYGKGLDEIKDRSAMKGKITLHFSDLTSRTDLYCIMHNARLRGDIDYNIGNYVEIKGNTITRINNNGKSIVNKYNGRLAYILNKGEGYGEAAEEYTAAQRALYKTINDWSRELSNKTGIDCAYEKNDNVSQNDASKALLNEAKDYAGQVGNESTIMKAKDNTDRNNIKVTPYTSHDVEYFRVGPFNWTFDGKIENVNVYGDNDNKINNIKFSKFEGNEEKFIESKEIKSNKNFYITLKANGDFKKIGKIEAKTKIENASTVYTTKIWFLKATENYQDLILVDTGSENTPSSVETPFEYDILVTKNLTIVKGDKKNNNIKLAGVGFKIKNVEMNKYVRKNNGNITYVDKKESATEFITDQNGKISIDGLIIGTYEAYETKNPNNEYKKVDGDIAIATIDPNVKEKYIGNEKEYVKVSGYVWKDIHSSKSTIRNDLYKTDRSDYKDDKDTAFNGITVRLKDSEGNTIQETTTKERNLYSEINGGEYIFTKVKIKELENYYVEFEYDGLIWQSVAVNKKENRGSKTTDINERKILDNNFATVDATGENKVNVNNKYSITYNKTNEHTTSIKDSSACTLHANTKDAGFNLKDEYTSETTEIKYINLGLYEKPQADLSLTQDVDNVNLGVNGYWHIYNYAKRELTNGGYDANNQNTWNVGVKFKNSYTGTYKRAIYKSDLDYERPDDRNKELQVYLTYKIALTNESSYVTKVNNIVDYFDNRYTLTKVGTGLDKQKNITGEISYHTPERYNDKYQKCIINANTTVKSGESNYIYVQFKLDRSAVLQIMNNKETLSNRAEINSYTVYKDNKRKYSCSR